MKYILFFIVCMINLVHAQDVDPNKRIQELGIELTELKAPIANYVKAVRSGNLLFLSGHIPDEVVGKKTRGKIGLQLTVDEGNEAAKITTIGLLSTLKYYAGDLKNVKRIVKVTGMLNADPAFTQHPTVMNGCSDLLVAVFGDAGRHARAAVGMSSLPLDAAIEIEMVVELK
jgi:enamine deaminase RidA (YjgF/YER057c/UK114 family)